MSSEERSAYVAIFSSVVTMIYFGVPIWNNTASGAYSVASGLAIWGTDVLWLMGGGIVITIVVAIVTHLLFVIANKGDSTESLMDERDRMIGRRGLLVTLMCVCAGFILSVIGFAMGWSAIAGLNLILIGMIFGSFASEVVRIAHYRLGL